MLGWAEPQLMAADVNAILLAREGREEWDHGLYTAVYGAAGITLPPLHPAEKPKLTAADFKGWAAAHNAARRSEQPKAPKPGQFKPPAAKQKPG